MFVFCKWCIFLVGKKWSGPVLSSNLPVCVFRLEIETIKIQCYYSKVCIKFCCLMGFKVLYSLLLFICLSTNLVSFLLLLFYFIIHMCTQGLGHFSPLPPPPPLPPTWVFFYVVFSWLCLTSSSQCRILLSIFHPAGLVVMNFFSFYLSWNVFISSSVVHDTFAGHSNLVWRFLIFF
jgi:hypothetical protein